jgi:hypothetical protein
MWQLLEADEFGPCFRFCEKKRPRELEAVLENLQTYHKALLAGTNPAQIPFRFVRQERYHGLVAIDQRGKGANLAQARLYLFPDLATKTLHLIRIGDKNTQTEDLRLCRKYVDSLLNQDDADAQPTRQPSKGTKERTAQECSGDGS